MRLAVVVAITVAMSRAIPASADCGSEAAELRHHLTLELHRADAWNTAWALGFAAATVGQLALVEAKVNPIGPFDDDFKASLRVGAIKSGLGAAARVLLPLQFSIPAPVADACADVRALHRAVARAGFKERRSIWLTLIAGTAMNLAGSIYLWSTHDFGTAAQSFLFGVPVGPIHALTQPRASAQLAKRNRIEWVVGLGSIGGAF